LGDFFSLLDRLLNAAEHGFFQKLNVVWIDNLFIDFDRKNFAGAVGGYLNFSTGRVYFDRFFLQFRQRLGHLRLHLLGLLHQFVQVHRRTSPLKISSASRINGSSA
jgi:hypothetical protein